MAAPTSQQTVHVIATRQRHSSGHIVSNRTQPDDELPMQNTASSKLEDSTFILEVIPVCCIGSSKLIILHLVWPPLDPSAQLGLRGDGHTGGLGMLHQVAVDLGCLLQQGLQICHTGPVLTTQLQQKPRSVLCALKAADVVTRDAEIAPRR